MENVNFETITGLYDIAEITWEEESECYVGVECNTVIEITADGRCRTTSDLYPKNPGSWYLGNGSNFSDLMMDYLWGEFETMDDDAVERAEKSIFEMLCSDGVFINVED